MTREEYMRLYGKYLSGDATSEEISEIMTYKDDFELQNVDINDKENYQLIETRIFDKIEQTLQSEKSKPAAKNYTWISAAAAVVILFALSALLLKSFHRPLSTAMNKPKPSKVNDPGPGGNKAVLILANGKKIILTDASNGTLNQQGGIIVKKQRDGQLQYIVQRDKSEHASGTISMNTISTPRGGQYQLVLADGTKVWLNAASSLQFPSSFAGKERKVELTGEAYFEVAKNKAMPFKVSFNHTEVEVLGTHFNIMAYPNEAQTKTTLLEGSVKISNSLGQQLLLPGQQAITATNGTLKVIEADIDETMGWKNGYFVFHNADIHEIMKQAERWYDVDVTYKGNINDKQFGGRISRYKNISKLLENLELTGSIHFKVEGTKVIVTE